MVGLRPQNDIKIESENVLTWLYTLLCFYNFELDFLIILSAATQEVSMVGLRPQNSRIISM